MSWQLNFSAMHASGLSPSKVNSTHSDTAVHTHVCTHIRRPKIPHWHTGWTKSCTLDIQSTCCYRLKL